MLTADDRLEIMELIARYNYAADTRDVEATLAEYTDDGMIEGDFRTREGKDVMRADLPQIFAAEGTLKRHLALNHRFVGRSGDAAEVHYMLLVVEGETSPAVGATSVIRDELRKVGGHWLVRRHHVKIDPSLKLPPR